MIGPSKTGREVIFMILIAVVSAVLAFAFGVFLLSLAAPKESRSAFWRLIGRLRSGLDFVCYWVFNLSALAVIGYLIWAVLRAIV